MFSWITLLAIAYVNVLVVFTGEMSRSTQSDRTVRFLTAVQCLFALVCSSFKQVNNVSPLEVF